jgi:hypothetical protein
VRFWIVMALLCGALFGVLCAFMRGQQARALADLPDSAHARPPAEVASALRAMKLVTVEVDSAVTVQRGDASWRGDVSAKVTVPVRLSYGTDLSAMSVAGVGYTPLGGAYVVRVPRPTRIATEIFGDKEKAQVEAGGLRLRSRAGEYYLGLARRDASEAARELELLPDDARRVTQTTREQVERLVKSVVGDSARVRVVFEGEGLP